MESKMSSLVGWSSAEKVNLSHEDESDLRSKEHD